MIDTVQQGVTQWLPHNWGRRYYQRRSITQWHCLARAVVESPLNERTDLKDTLRQQG